jgi:hypothetical protein
MLDGSATGEMFERSSEPLVVPSLKPGQIVVMDHVRSHTGQQVRQLIEAQGCPLWFLPASSADCSPLEEAFSMIKAVLRRIGARSRETRQEALE